VHWAAMTTLLIQYNKARYTEHIKALTLPLIKSNFAEHTFNTHLTYTNIEANYHKVPK